MLNIEKSGQFKHDYKQVLKRGLKPSLLEFVVTELAEGRKLSKKYRDHELTNNYAGHRECHIKPDWLLIYYCTEKSLVLVRTGSHSDLF